MAQVKVHREKGCGYIRQAAEAPLVTIPRERLTPPCGRCNYPLLRSDTHCPRCRVEGR